MLPKNQSNLQKVYSFWQTICAKTFLQQTKLLAIGQNPECPDRSLRSIEQY